MTSKLRNLILAPAAVLAFALASHTAMADATAKVPFSFTVDGHVCPAGDYVVRRDMRTNTVTLQGRNNKVGFMWSLKAGDAAPAAKNVVLRFTEDGENHALRFVQYGPQSTYQLDKKNSNQKEHETLRSITAGQ
jgi:hypothetical protein